MTTLEIINLVLIVALFALSLTNVIATAKERRGWQEEREQWVTERSKLLDRIQSGSLTEFKSQERADKPVQRKEKDPKKLEDKPWA